MTVLVTGKITDATGREDSRRWRAWSPVYREGPNGEVITTRDDYPVRVVGGVFSAPMHPGVAVIENPDGRRYTVTVLDEDCDLWELIATAVAFPPDTSAEALASAVTTYLEENPVTSVIAEGITDSGAAGRAAVQADAEADLRSAAGASTVGAQVFTAAGGSGSATSINTRVVGGMSASSGVQRGLQVAPTVAQSGTAGYTLLEVNATESSTGSGAKKLMDLQVGGASKFTVDNTGAAFIANTSAPATPTGGGVLYVESGALKFKGSGGTVTTLGPA